MTYIDLMNALFAEQAANEKIGADEIAVYSYIIHLANRQQWPDHGVSVSTKRIMDALGISKDKFYRARGNLSEANLLFFDEGTRKSAPIYHFISNPTPNLNPTQQPTRYKTDKRTEKQRERQEESSPSPSALIDLFEAEFPDRADIADCVQAAEAHQKAQGKPLYEAYVRKWILGEETPRFKPKPEPKPEPEPEGFQEWLAEAYSTATITDWDYVRKEHPGIVEEFREYLATRTGT